MMDSVKAPGDAAGSPGHARPPAEHYPEHSRPAAPEGMPCQEENDGGEVMIEMQASSIFGPIALSNVADEDSKQNTLEGKSKELAEQQKVT